MVLLESLKDIRDAKVADVGSKAKALAELAERGFRVPTAMCISTAGYEAYVAGTSLRDRVLFELGLVLFVASPQESLQLQGLSGCG